MNYLFPQLGDFEKDVSVKDTPKYLRDSKQSGLIEKRFHTGGYAVMIFAGGTPEAAYQLVDGESNSLLFSEFFALPESNIFDARVIKLPDVAGRLATFAYQSKPGFQSLIKNVGDWHGYTEDWKREKWSGLVEIKTETVYKLVLIWRGELQSADTVFSTPAGFTAEAANFENLGEFPWDMRVYSLSNSEPAYQYATLRYGIMKWMGAILNRYQELVGRKLLATMDQELNRQIDPWGWKINLKETVMTDSHYFVTLQDAEHAYRALFMSMGMLMNIIIGNNLTQRLLNETFEQLCPDERELLLSMRLIPAAFSE
jgi:hypothetical protein